MMAAIVILVVLLMIVGLFGSALPFLPGTPLILLGAFIYALATDFEPIGPWRLTLLLGLTLLAHALDYVSGALGTQKVGASRWAMLGALVGGIVGIFFGPFGIILGPIIGAVGCELIYRKEIEAGLKSGFGAVIGMFFGVVARLSLAVIMIGLFTFWAFRG